MKKTSEQFGPLNRLIPVVRFLDFSPESEDSKQLNERLTKALYMALYKAFKRGVIPNSSENSNFANLDTD